MEPTAFLYTQNRCVKLKKKNIKCISLTLTCHTKLQETLCLLVQNKIKTINQNTGSFWTVRGAVVSVQTNMVWFLL